VLKLRTPQNPSRVNVRLVIHKRTAAFILLTCTTTSDAGVFAYRCNSK